MNKYRNQVVTNDFFRRDDVVQIARELLGKVLCTRFDGVLTSGRIVETEAYNGVFDQACHAYGGRRTNRTDVMYQPGGVAYVYLCYGIHHLFNVITNIEDIPDAVLIRAVEPLDGMDAMLQRREMQRPERRLTAGPGVMSRALSITTNLNGRPLTPESGIWIEQRFPPVVEKEIETGTRVGIGYAGEDAQLPWRFCIKGNKWVSPAK